MNIPNVLTLSRVTLVPVFVLLFCLPTDWSRVAACAVFILAALTDLLDGWLARYLRQTSELGAFLDPVADKLMVATALVLLVGRDPSLWLALPAVVIISREIAVSALREWMAEVGNRSRVAVSRLGKVKTNAQMLSIILLIYRDKLFSMPVYELGMVLLHVAAVLTLWSMYRYLRAAWPDLSK